MKRRLIVNIITNLLLSCFALIVLFPILWTFLTSLKSDLQMFAIPPKIIPSPVTLKHYAEVIINGVFPLYLRNSLTVAFFSCLVSLLAGIPAAYGFAKFSGRGTKAVFASVTAVRMVPQIAMVIPFFMIIRKLRLSDSVIGLIITYIPFEITTIVWILKNFFAQVPREIEEAAELDGLGAWGRLFRVVVPLSRSSIGVAGLLSFLFSWNEFMFALSLTSTSRAQTLTIGIAGFVTSFQTFWGKMSATGILFVIPALLLTLVFQKDLVKGLTAGAVKG